MANNNQDSLEVERRRVNRTTDRDTNEELRRTEVGSESTRQRNSDGLTVNRGDTRIGIRSAARVGNGNRTYRDIRNLSTGILNLDIRRSGESSSDMTIAVARHIKHVRFKTYHRSRGNTIASLVVPESRSGIGMPIGVRTVSRMRSRIGVFLTDTHPLRRTRRKISEINWIVSP